MSHQKIEHAQKRPRVWFLVLSAAVLLLLVLLFATAMVMTNRGEPFRLTIHPDGDHTLVQFSWPNEGLLSPTFRVAVPVDEPQVIVLGRGEVTISGGVVEFSDTTLLPGRFQIRLGETHFDVMSSHLRVDGEKFDWEPEELGPLE
ncbi:hypothetical protein BH23PLA1_BH23PLA1_08560 [soil metagenome]